MSGGLCACGCGRPTRISEHTDRSKGWVKGQARRYIHGHNSRGESGPNWSGGRYRTSDGYVVVLMPEHPRADAKGYVREHVLIAERALGRQLPDAATVHHVDEDPGNNVGNLVLCEDQSYHMLLHQRMRALDACGDASALKCPYCRQYDHPSALVVLSRAGRPGERWYHQRCRMEYERRRRSA